MSDSRLPEIGRRAAAVHAALIAAVTLVLLLWLNPSSSPGAWGRFLSRFHPSMVHFPVALLAVGALLDLAAVRMPVLRGPARWLYLGGAWCGVAALTAGLLLAQSGGYDPSTLRLHKWAAVGITLLAAVAPLLHFRLPAKAQAGVPIALLAAVVFGGHEGGTLTHGPGYLTAHAPPLLASVIGSGGQNSTLALGDPDSTTVYEGIVAPILGARCTACHGEGRIRGGLDLSSPEGVREGGDDGPVVVPGRPDASELVARIELPAHHDDVMPPADSSPLSPSDARLLTWWVEQGASFDLTLSAAAFDPATRRILDAHGLGEIRTGVWALDVGPAPVARLEALRQLGAQVEPVAQSENQLSVRCRERTQCFGDDGGALRALADQVVWLDLARSDVTDEDLEALASLTRLEKLWLQGTSITSIDALTDLPYLAYLNVSQTRVDSTRLGAVAHVPAVYAWDTRAD